MCAARSAVISNGVKVTGMIQGDSASVSNDPYDLNRFTSAQEGVYDRALAELRGGQKRSHWMWYIFPQIDGLGHSPSTRHYSILFHGRPLNVC